MISKERITSRNNSKVVEALLLAKEKEGYFLVEGFHMVELALKNDVVAVLFSVSKLYPDYPKVPQYLVSDAVLSKLASTKTPEGVVALVQKRESEPFSSKSPLLYLNAVQDPGNVGTLLRTALSFGFKDVFLGFGSANPFSPKCLMASQGSLFELNVVTSKERDSLKDLERLRKEGYYLLSTSLKDAIPLKEFPFSRIDKPIALILGNEGKGVLESLNSYSDNRVKIEMKGFESLNVAIAGGILMYEIQKGGSL